MDHLTTVYPNFPPYTSGGLPELNVAATSVAAQTLGPGLRSIVWVQGCPFHCAGCIAPGWIPMVPARSVQPEVLVEELLADRRINGLTFSGGEPMLQAAGLARVAHLARHKRPDLTLICFTGFTLERLLTRPVYAGVNELLEETDVLIDGVYIAARNDNRGLRGSSNQRIHCLTDRLGGWDFETQPRRVEVRIMDGFAQFVGVPPVEFTQLFEGVLARAALPTADAAIGG